MATLVCITLARSQLLRLVRPVCRGFPMTAEDRVEPSPSSRSPRAPGARPGNRDAVRRRVSLAAILRLRRGRDDFRAWLPQLDPLGGLA